MSSVSSLGNAKLVTRLGAVLLVFMGSAFAKSMKSLLPTTTSQSQFCGKSCGADSQCGGNCPKCHSNDGTISYTCHN